jgi:uncharacterized protein
MATTRYLEAPVAQDLATKMVLLAGPRQVGKTTLARNLLTGCERGLYLNWDRREDRETMRATRWPAGPALVVLDEVHKWRGWKTWLKGEFDHHRESLSFLVTGSARLEVYRRGADSLQGRYHHYRLHPLSYREALGELSAPEIVPGQELAIPARGRPELITNLLQWSGFPEPFFAQSERSARRWRKERLERFFREDVRDLEKISDLSSLQILADLIPERVGSTLSLNALREDLEVSHRTITHWVEILDRLYYLFRIPPYSSNKVRALRKATKVYLWDSGLVASPGGRFENLVALHLLKFCHYLEDVEGYPVALSYLRDRNGHEVDFLVTVGGKPWFAVEAKLGGERVDPHLHYYRERLAIPWVYQVVQTGERDYVENGVRVVPAASFFAALV